MDDRDGAHDRRRTWPWAISPIPFAFAVAALGLVAFIAWGLHRQRQGRSTLRAFSLFRISSFRSGNIAALVVSLGEFGIILSLPLWLQFVIGFDALQTGFVLLALAVGSFVASGFAGALLLPFLFVYGFGVGLATAQLTSVVLSDVPVAESGQGSGTQSTARQLGSALGVAILGTVLFTSTAGILGARLDDRGVEPAERDQVVSAVVDSAGGAIAGLDQADPTGQTAADARAAFSEGTRGPRSPRRGS